MKTDNKKTLDLDLTINIPDGGSTPRTKMPQIKNHEEFLRWLGANNFKFVDNGSANPFDLKAVQKDYHPSTVHSLVVDVKKWIHKSLIISNDNYVLDGNHRWLAAKTLKLPRIPVVVLEYSKAKALEIVRNFSNQTNNSTPTSVSITEETKKPTRNTKIKLIDPENSLTEWMIKGLTNKTPDWETYFNAQDDRDRKLRFYGGFFNIETGEIWATQERMGHESLMWLFREKGKLGNTKEGNFGYYKEAFASGWVRFVMSGTNDLAFTWDPLTNNSLYGSNDKKRLFKKTKKLEQIVIYCANKFGNSYSGRIALDILNGYDLIDIKKLGSERLMSSRIRKFFDDEVFPTQPPTSLKEENEFSDYDWLLEIPPKNKTSFSPNFEEYVKEEKFLVYGCVLSLSTGKIYAIKQSTNSGSHADVVELLDEYNENVIRIVGSPRSRGIEIEFTNKDQETLNKAKISTLLFMKALSSSKRVNELYFDVWSPSTHPKRISKHQTIIPKPKEIRAFFDTLSSPKNK